MRRTVPVAGTVALLFALTACGTETPTAQRQPGETQSSGAGGGGHEQAPPQVQPRVALASAVKKLDEKATARVTATVKVPGETTVMKGVVRFGSPMVGRFDINGTDKEMPGTFKMLMTPDAMYMHVPDMAKELDGKTWMRMGYADMAKAGGKAGGGLGAALQKNFTEGQDPRSELKLLQSSANLKAVGTETMDGVPTTHYQGTVDTAKAVSDSAVGSMLTAAEKAKLRKQMAKIGLGKAVMHVWVDAKGWPRRTVMKAGSGKTAAETRQEFSDFGVPVEVTPPPASKVWDFKQFLVMFEEMQKGAKS